MFPSRKHKMPPPLTFFQILPSLNSCVIQRISAEMCTVTVSTLFAYCGDSISDCGFVSLGLITNRGLVEQVPAHFTSVFIPVGTTEHK